MKCIVLSSRTNYFIVLVSLILFLIGLTYLLYLTMILELMSLFFLVGFIITILILALYFYLNNYVFGYLDLPSRECVFSGFLFNRNVNASEIKFIKKLFVGLKIVKISVENRVCYYIETIPNSEQYFITDEKTS